MTAARPLTFAQQQRLIWIDAHLAGYGGQLNRADIQGAFGLSPAQASADLSLFQAEHPHRIEYDHRRKVYRAAAGSIPAYSSETRYAVVRAARLVRESMAQVTQ